jgi:hypothetical protein
VVLGLAKGGADSENRALAVGANTQGDEDGAVDANALVEGGGIELQATADLWDIEGDSTQAGGEGLVFVAVGVAEAALGSLVGFRAQGGGALANHGRIDKEADAFGEAVGEAVGTLFGEQLHDGGQEVRVLWVDHG